MILRNILKRILILILPVFLIYSASGQDILYDFETGRSGFTCYADGSLTATIDTSSENPYSGNFSLVTEITNNGTGSVQLVAKRIDVVPGETFTVRFFMRTSENRTVIIKSQYNLDGGGLAVFWEKENVDVTTMWQLFEVLIAVPSEINGHAPLNVFVGFIELNVGEVMGMKYYIDDYEVDYHVIPVDNGIPEKFYVSPSGDDGNVGSKVAPFKTITAAAGLAGAGDTVFIRKGVYNETVIPGSGSENNPLIFMAYPGEKVIITGTDTAENWQLYENNIFYTEIPDNVTQVFCNGSQMTGARWPNLVNDELFSPEYAQIDNLIKASIGDTAILSDAGLSGLNDLAGSRVWMQGKGMWGSMSESIIDHNGTQVRFINHQTDDINSDAYPDNDSWFFIYGSKSLLDAEKEWYYDMNEKHVFFRAPGSINPNEDTILVRTRQQGVDLRYKYVKVQGIEFFAAGAIITGDYNIIEECTFYYPCPFFDAQIWNISPGILIKGSENIIHKCEVAFSWGTGIEIAGTWDPDDSPYLNQHIENNLIHHTNWMGAYDGAIWVKGKGHHIGNNTIYMTGRSGIHGVNKRCIMEKNHIYGFGYLSHDCGAFYLGMGDDPEGDKDSLVIKKNYTHLMNSGLNPNSDYLVSIYLDVGSSNALIFNNITQETFVGVQMNGQVINNMVFNNIMYDVTWRAMHQYDQGNPNNKYINVITYNNISDNSNFLGTDQRNNIYKPEFTDFKLAGPEYGDFRPLPGSPVIDAGTEVAGYNDYAIDQPDAGPYEFGAVDDAGDWIAGITWSPSWNKLPSADILVEQDTLNPGKYYFSVINDSDSDGWIMRYDWDFGDGTSAYGKKVFHTYLQSGLKTVNVSIQDNLAGRKIIQTVIDNNVNINYPDQADKVTLFPNPAKEYLVIKSEMSLEYVKILDVRGNILKEFTDLDVGETILNIRGLPEGFLIIHIQDHYHSCYLKIIKY